MPATSLSPFYYFHTADFVHAAASIAVQSGSTGDTAYPAANLVNFTPAKIAAPAKVTGGTGYWIGTFPAAQRVDFVIFWHNAEEAINLVFQMHASDSWGTPTVSASVAAPAVRADGYTRKVAIDLRDVSGYSTGGLQYFRVGAAGNSAPLGLKILLASRVRQWDRDFQWGVSVDDNQTGILQRTDGGVRWAYDLSSAPRVMRGTALLSDVDAERAREWHRACAGLVGLTAVVPEPTNLLGVWPGYFSPGSYGIDAAGLAISKITTQRQSPDISQLAQIAIEELCAGDPEWV